jgi:hypothetical protein
LRPESFFKPFQRRSGEGDAGPARLEICDCPALLGNDLVF